MGDGEKLSERVSEKNWQFIKPAKKSEIFTTTCVRNTIIYLLPYMILMLSTE